MYEWITFSIYANLINSQLLHREADSRAQCSELNPSSKSRGLYSSTTQYPIEFTFDIARAPFVKEERLD